MSHAPGYEPIAGERHRHRGVEHAHPHRGPHTHEHTHGSRGHGHFTTPRKARQRLAELYELRVLDRFRPAWQQGEGSTPHHWTLDAAGAQTASPSDAGSAATTTISAVEKNPTNRVRGNSCLMLPLDQGASAQPKRCASLAA
jgi:hypothetical protein